MGGTAGRGLTCSSPSLKVASTVASYNCLLGGGLRLIRSNGRRHFPKIVAEGSPRIPRRGRWGARAMVVGHLGRAGRRRSLRIARGARLGSVFDCVFHVANQVALTVRAEFPDGWVSFYARSNFLVRLKRFTFGWLSETVREW